MNMPWHNTQSLVNGIGALNRMYNSLEHNSPLKMFLNMHCLHLLKPLEGDTGIPIDYAKPQYLSSLPQCLDLDSTYNPRQFNTLPTVVGTYVFFLENAERVTQCGSSIRIPGRMFNHYLDSGKRLFIFESASISDYKWIVIKHTDNYVSLYDMHNNMTPEDEYILTSFMQQEIRSLEQAYTTFVQPTNYKGVEINTWHNSWTLGTTGTANLAKRVTWLNEQGESFSRSSIKAAATELGFDPKQVKNVAKLGSVLNTSKYGKVTVLIDGVTKINTPLDKRYGTLVNDIVDTTVLLPKHYYLYDADMNQLPIGPFKSLRATNEALGLAPNYGGTHLWCNYMHLVKAPSLDLSVYVVKLGSGSSVPVLVRNMSDNVVTEYPAMSAAALALGVKTDDNLLVYAAKGTPVLSTDGIKYLVEFKSQLDREKGLARYNKRLATLKASRTTK